MKRICILTAPTETGLCGTCDLLPGWVVSTSGSFSDFKKEASESVSFYLECAKADGDEVAAEFDDDWALDFVFDVRAVLCYLRGLMSFAALEHLTGINQKQLAHYAAGRSNPRPEQGKKIVEGLHSFAHLLLSIEVR